MKRDVFTLPPAEPRVFPRLPRRAVYGPPPKRLPRLTRFAFEVVVALLLVGLSFAIARAEQEVDAGERYTPTSRGTRPAVLERAEVVDLAAEVFGTDVRYYVAAIVACESSNNRWARSAGWDRLFGRYDQRGLLQIEATLWLPLARELTGSDDLFDPVVNLIVGRAIQQQQGWRAWPWCSR